MISRISQQAAVVAVAGSLTVLGSPSTAFAGLKLLDQSADPSKFDTEEFLPKR